MSFTDDFLERLSMASPIEDVMQSYTKLVRRGNRYVCLCPFHSEKTPSCVVYPETRSFFCFGCRVGGDVITFIKRIENVGYREAVEILANRAGLPIPDYGRDSENLKLRNTVYEINRKSAVFFHRSLTEDPARKGLRYLAERGLDPNVCNRFGIGYAPESWDKLRWHLSSCGFKTQQLIDAGVCTQKGGKVFDMFRNRIMFPIIDTKGNVIGFGGRVLDGSLPKYINTADTPVFKKSRNLFSMNFAKTAISGQPKESRRIILAEGYMDVVSIYAAGFENAVATLGTALTQDQAKLLHNCTNQVIIAYDSDSAGRAAAVKAVKILVNEGITPFIINTGGAKDPDEYIKMYGAARFKKLVNSAGDAVLFALDECKEGLDLNTEVEKIECVRRAVKVLADIKDDVSRDIYLTKTAKDLEVSSEMLRAGVKRQTGGEEPVRQAEDYILPKAVPVPQIYGIKTKEQRSQESVIAYLMRNPAAAGELSQKISPDLFTDADCSGIYSVLTERLKISENFTLSLFANELNSTEMGKITEIEINYREISITPDYIEDCIGVLQGMNNLNSAVESDEDLLNLAMRLKSADQYSNFD